MKFLKKAGAYLGDKLAQAKERIGGGSTLSTGGKNVLLAGALATAIGTSVIAVEAYKGYMRNDDKIAKSEMMINDSGDEKILQDSTKENTTAFVNSLPADQKTELQELIKKLNMEININNLTNKDIKDILEQKVKPMIQDESNAARRNMWISLGALLIVLLLLNNLHKKHEKYAKLIISAEFRQFIEQDLGKSTIIDGIFGALATDFDEEKGPESIEDDRKNKVELIEKTIRKLTENKDLLSNLPGELTSEKLETLVNIILPLLNSGSKESVELKAVVEEISKVNTNIKSISNDISTTTKVSDKILKIKEKQKLADSIKPTIEKGLGIIKNIGPNVQKGLDSLLIQKKNEIDDINHKAQEAKDSFAKAKTQLERRDTEKDNILDTMFPKENSLKYETEIQATEAKIAKLEQELEQDIANNSVAQSKEKAYTELLQIVQPKYALTNEQINDIDTTIVTTETNIENDNKTEFTIEGSQYTLSQIIKKENDGYSMNDIGEKIKDDNMIIGIGEICERLEKNEGMLADLKLLKKAKLENNGNVINIKTKELQLKDLNKTRDKAYLNLDLVETVNENLKVVRQAFEITVSELRGAGGLSIEQVYDHFISNIQRINPDWSIPSLSGQGIQGLQNTLIHRQDNITTDFIIKALEVSAGVAGAYHAERGLLNKFPEVFATSSEGIVGGLALSILGGVAVYITADAIIKALRDQYKNSLSSNEGNTWLLKEISLMKAITDNYLTKKIGIASILVYCAAGATTGADLLGSGATWAAEARKQEIHTALDTESNKIQFNINNFGKSMDTLFMGDGNLGYQTTKTEVDSGGAGEGAAKKIAYLYGKDTKNWKNGADSSLVASVNENKRKGFDESLNSVPDSLQGQWVDIIENYNTETKKIKESMFIIWKGDSIPLAQVPRLVNNLETGITNVNVSHEIAQIKELYQEKIDTIINSYIALVKSSNAKMETLENYLKGAGGRAPVVFKKIDTNVLETLINTKLKEPVKKFLEAMSKANPYFDSLGDMIGTVIKLPIGTRESTLIWLAFVSMIPVWLIAKKRHQWGKAQNKKGEEATNDDVEVLAQDAFQSLQHDIEDIKRQNPTLGQHLKTLEQGENYEAISLFFGIPEHPSKVFEETRTEMGRRGKPKRDKQLSTQQEAIKQTHQDIINIIKSNKTELDKDLGYISDYSSLSDSLANPVKKELCTDRFMRMKNHDEKTFGTAVADMMSKSDVFTNLMIKYVIDKSVAIKK